MRISPWLLLSGGLGLCGVLGTVAAGLTAVHSRAFGEVLIQSLVFHATATAVVGASYIIVSDHPYHLVLVFGGLALFVVFGPLWAAMITAAAVDGDLGGRGVWLIHVLVELPAAWVYLCYGSLVRPRMRPTVFHALLSWPACTHFTAVFLSALFMPLLIWLPEKVWALPILLAPHALALFGLRQSLTNHPWEEVPLRCQRLDPEAPPLPGPFKVVRRRREAYPLLPVRALPEWRDAGPSTGGDGSDSDRRPLRIVQITDVHVGGFMSVQRLAAICLTVAETLNPDLVFLTGDFTTPEADHAPTALHDALLPLQRLPGRVIACLGNHDKESPAIQSAIIQQLESLGVQVLIDGDVTVDVPQVGPVHVLGTDFLWRQQREALHALCDRFPVPPEAQYTILLLHDPACFRHVPPDRGCLALSGHTHGGQVGLLSCGLRGTIVGCAGHPDHGVFQQGRNTLYVHRGQGFRSLSCNFVLRVGVPNELSLLQLTTDPAA